MRRNCSHLSDYHHQSVDLTNRFTQRGYPTHVLREAHQFALEQDTSKLLTLKPQMEEEGFMSIIATFDGRSDEAIGILRKYWDILRSDIDLGDVIPRRSLERGVH